MKKNGIIILLHSIHRTISEEEILDFLPPAYKSCPRRFVIIEPSLFDISDSWNQDFFSLSVRQRNQYLEEIKPLLENESFSKIIYFGAAPIPLAMQLGFLIGDYEDLEIYQHHHDLKTWKWQDSEDTINPHSTDVPGELYRIDGDVQIRMSTSVRVDEDHCKEVLPNPVKDIHIFMDELGRDIFTKQNELTVVSAHFRDVLDSIQSNLPNIDYVHFFGAIPVGLAFLLGSKINPTIHKPIQTYQFKIDASPKYTPAILIQASTSEQSIISDEEIQAAQKLRTDINQMLQEEIGAFIETIKNSGQEIWYISLLPQNTDTTKFQVPQWHNLPNIFALRLLGDNVPTEIKSNPIEVFFYDAGKRSWLLADSFIVLLRRKFPELEDFKKAIRMFLFHESLHFTQHRLTSTTTSGIGNFPKVIEEADYQADVWAMFHEYDFSSRSNRKVLKNPREYFLGLIETAIQTMWSFFPQGSLIRQMQIRRVNRFLMWHWQFLLIEGLPHNSTLKDIIDILLQKPNIELSGPPIKSYNQRVYFDLTIPATSTPELAIFHNNIVSRFGQTSNLNIISLINAFRERDSVLIKDILRNVAESVTRES